MSNSAEILVVDDTPANLEVITETLSSAGYTVAAVTSGERALKRLNTYIPDLILLDIKMPGLDGFATCQKIKANSDTANIPIIFITVFSDTDSICQGFSLGAVDYITKPFREPELLARVKTHLQLHNTLAQLHQSQLEQAQLNRKLEQANQQLAHYSQRLEAKVEERTAALQERETRYRVLMNGASDGILLADSQGNLLEVNYRAEKLLGYSRAELTSMHFTQLHPSEDLPTIISAFEQVANQQSNQILDINFLCKDGRTVSVDVSASVIEIHGQKIIQNMLRDISNRKRAEEQIRRYASQLEASNRELEAFAYSVSHDLRAPLRAIDGFSRALLEDYGNTFNEEGRDYFERIRKNVTRMGMLIDDLLRLSRVSRSEINYTTVNLSTLAQELLNDLQESEPERQVQVKIASQVIVCADATLMRVVLSNLLGNAWKFTSQRGKAKIEFGLIQKEGKTIYFVRDNGAGFDMSYANKLFGVFQRLHSTDEFPGTGIGLATVQRSIHRHGGRIWAQAAIDRGAIFYFTLSQTENTVSPET